MDLDEIAIVVVAGDLRVDKDRNPPRVKLAGFADGFIHLVGRFEPAKPNSGKPRGPLW